MQLYYQHFGEGQPIIILHGLFGMSDNWVTIAHKMAETYQVFVLDLRNHGQSPNSEVFHYDALSGDVIEFLEQHDLESATLLGHSMGGKVAMRCALDAPDRIDHLIVADIAPRAYQPGHRDIFQAMYSVDLSKVDTLRDVDQAMSEYIPQKPIRQFLMKNLQRNEDDQFFWQLNLDSLYRNYDLILDHIDAETSYDGPVLFLAGTNSDYISDRDATDIKRLFPKAQIEEIAEVGHWMHAEAPEVFTQLILDFLSETSH